MMRPYRNEQTDLRDYLATAEEPPREWPRLLPIIIALLIFLAGVFVGAKAYGAEIVSLKVQPAIMLHRSDIRVDARVPPSAENRILSIAWASEHGTAGESMRQLEGADAPLVTTLWLRDQAPVDYVFVATVFNARGKIRGRAEAEIHAPDDGGAK